MLYEVITRCALVESGMYLHLLKILGQLNTFNRAHNNPFTQNLGSFGFESGTILKRDDNDGAFFGIFVIEQVDPDYQRNDWYNPYKPVTAVRITSYNVCYTKLLR